MRLPQFVHFLSPRHAVDAWHARNAWLGTAMQLVHTSSRFCDQSPERFLLYSSPNNVLCTYGQSGMGPGRMGQEPTKGKRHDYV